MKALTYKPEHFGMTEFPSGTLRFDGVEQTDKPEEADIFIIPPSLMHLRTSEQVPGSGNNNARAFLERLPYFSGREERHVGFDVSDFDQVYHSKAILIRCNVKPHMRKADPNTISWAWPVEDFKECIELPPDGFKYDVSFHAWISTETRRLSGLSCQNNPKLKCDVSMYKDFTGYIYYEPEGVRRRAEFRRSMRESRIALCPESIPSVFPYRFFEAMSAGRVPLLVASDYELPFADLIPYREFILTCRREDAFHASSVIEQFFNRYRTREEADQVLINMGQKGRMYWEQYLNREDWVSRTMLLAVKKKLREIGLYKGE